MSHQKTMTPEIAEAMITDQKVRVKIIEASHWHFFHFYFAHYVKYPTAQFQAEMFDLTENEKAGNFFIVAFRGSGKSTIITTSYPIWAILGKQQKKFVLILCQTQSQAKQHMMNLRQELENNTVLKNDLGPFREESDEWGSASLVFSQLNARITVASREQSIRGLRHNQHRPDLIICDDVEDMASTKTREGRNKTYQWLTAEVIPTGDRNTRLVIVGNLLHEDSLLMRIKEDVRKERIDGVFKEYPIIRGKEILWPGKYPSMEDIEREKRKAGNEFAWEREYMLHIVSDEEQAIHREWIHYYDELPHGEKDWQNFDKHIEVRIGVDLAISKKDTADYTAMVPAWLYGDGKDLRIYILPQVVNRKMDFPETVELCKAIDNSYFQENDRHPAFVIEDVAYQKSLPQQLISEGIRDVRTTRPGNQDKRTRLILTAYAVKSGKVLFPRQGCEELINQIVHFGVESHDDLADAFSNVVLNTLEDPPIMPRIIFV
ncbi:MAG: phage terminase large subunit [Candidatus Moranbacteria bacterium]|nr:phage terminase large subunit [Candidatus Moranbacteria bacterium]